MQKCNIINSYAYVVCFVTWPKILTPMRVIVNRLRNNCRFLNRCNDLYSMRRALDNLTLPCEACIKTALEINVNENVVRQIALNSMLGTSRTGLLFAVILAESIMVFFGIQLFSTCYLHLHKFTRSAMRD